MGAKKEEKKSVLQNFKSGLQNMIGQLKAEDAMVHEKINEMLLSH
jgi:hypothetical protein